MRCLQICLFAALLPPAAIHSQDLPSAPQPAKTQSGSSDAGDEAWDRLNFLTPNSQISVKTTRGTYHCEDPRVTDTQLDCEIPSPRGPLGAFIGPRSIQLNRFEVAEVGLRHPYRIRLIGYGTAAAAGIAFGAVGANPPSGQPRAVTAAAGAAIFCVAAIPIVELIEAFSHGTTLFRRPRIAAALAPLPLAPKS
jgi:hypothetical protein